MVVCDTCNGMGSVAEGKVPGNTLRCKDCGGTGRMGVKKGKGETPLARTDSTKEA
jgi:DnaJ-class molecular chaperone